ncbi:MAG: hypothetical protein V3V12_09615 [Gammaproteobacteria bacterium]
MEIPEPVQPYLRIKTNELLDELNVKLDHNDGTENNDNYDLSLLREAFSKLYDTMATLDIAAHHDIPSLGEYALNLCTNGSSLAGKLSLPQVQSEFEKLSVTIALWIARNQGELITLEIVVDGLAKYANLAKEPEELRKIYAVISEIMSVIATPLRLDLDKSNPGRPWRILNLNRAIIATRTHQPAIMEEAFEAFIHNLPEEAPGFFTEGMKQMEQMTYPDPVRNVMESYYLKWANDKELH